MASSKELVELFNGGALGRLLTQTFGGELGHTPPNKDADFIVVFKNQTDVPEPAAVKTAVEDYYRKLGYPIKSESYSNGSTGFAIVLDEVIVAITITTHYPFDGAHACIRATSILS